MNLCQIVGRLGKDPDIRYTKAGKPVVNLSVATEERRRDAQGNEMKKTTWHNVVCFGYAAEDAQGYEKGGLVYVAGPMESDEYTRADGTKARSYKVRADTIYALATRQRGPAEKQEKPRPASAPKPRSLEPSNAQQEDFDDDIPF